MGLLVDLTGRVFNHLTVIRQQGRNKQGSVLWLCDCTCGNTVVVSSNSLNRGNTKSCGCKGYQTIDRIGHIYGRLTVLKRVIGGKGYSGARWLCKCECGNEKVISATALRGGDTRSCGCLQKEVKSIKGEKSPHWKGGRIITRGYIKLHKANHPNAHTDGYVFEHIYIMSKLLGRPLEKKETVHHKNGIRNDNDPSNLELWVSSHPSGQRVSDLIAWAKELLVVYEPTALK